MYSDRRPQKDTFELHKMPSENDRGEKAPKTKDSMPDLYDLMKKSMDKDKFEEAKGILVQVVNSLLNEVIPARLRTLSILQASGEFSDLDRQQSVHLAKAEDLFREDADNQVKVLANPFVTDMMSLLSPPFKLLHEDLNDIRIASLCQLAHLRNSKAYLDKTDKAVEVKEMISGMGDKLGQMDRYVKETYDKWSKYGKDRADILVKFQASKVPEQLRLINDLDDEMVAALCITLGNMIVLYMDLENSIESIFTNILKCPECQST